MNSTETKKILAVMMVTYPNYKVNDIEMAISVWTEMLSEYTYQQVSVALKSFMASDTSGFAPSIGQLIDRIHTTQEMATEENESAVWGKVMRAICNSSYHAKEEFEKLDEISQKILGSHEALHRMASDEEFNESVQKSLFMRSYKELKQKEKEYARLPQEVRISIENRRNFGIGVNN